MFFFKIGRPDKAAKECKSCAPFRSNDPRNPWYKRIRQAKVILVFLFRFILDFCYKIKSTGWYHRHQHDLTSILNPGLQAVAYWKYANWDFRVKVLVIMLHF